jgi:hypothetical protein
MVLTQECFGDQVCKEARTAYVIFLGTVIAGVVSRK